MKEEPRTILLKSADCSTIIRFGSFMNSVTISIHKMLTLILARKRLIFGVVVLSVCGSLVKAMTTCGGKRCDKGTRSYCVGDDCKCKWKHSIRKTFEREGHIAQACYKMKICNGKRCGIGTKNDCDGENCECQDDYSFRTTIDNWLQICRRKCYYPNKNCPVHSTCILLTTSQGYNGGGCDCQQGYVWSKDNEICIDRDECKDGIAGCSDNARCINTEGSYSCHCNIGYIHSDSLTCKDINECEDGNLCQDLAHTFCNITEGSYICDCLSGYSSSARNNSCYDIDECKGGNICQDLENTSCNNTEGSYSCDCLSGYNSSARNTSCYDTNECVTTPEVCGNHSECVNMPGNYTCHSRHGYEINLDGNSNCILAQLGSRAFERSSPRSLVGLYIGLPVAVVALLVLGITVILIRRKRISQKSRDEQAKNLEETIANNVSYENVIAKDTNNDSALSFKMADIRSVSMGISRANKPHSNLNKRKKVLSVEYSNHKIPENKQKLETKDPKGNSQADETGSSVTSIDRQIQDCETYNVLDVCNLKTNPVDKNVLHKDNQNTYNDLYDVNPTSMNLTYDKIDDGFDAKCTSREEIPQESNSNTSLYDFPKTLKEDLEQGIHKDSETEVMYENKHNSSDYYNLTGFCDTNVSSTD